MNSRALPFSASSTWQQIWLIARLRWLLMRAMLGTTGAKLDLAAKVIVGALGGLVAIGLGVGLGVMAYAAAGRGRLGIVTALLWGIFLAWQVFPIVLAVSGSQFQFRDLLRFPLRFSTFYVLSLMYALFDPVAVCSVYWLACVGVGVVAARGDMLPWVLLVIPVLGVVTLLLNRVIFSWLERVLAHRRAREVMLVIFVLSALSLQLMGGMAERLKRDSLNPYVQPLMQAAQALPPGLAGMALTRAATGERAPALWLTVAAAGYGVLFAILLRRRLLAQYRGEDNTESSVRRAQAGSARDAAAEASQGAPAFLRGPLAALIKKDVRYLRRNMQQLLLLAAPLFLIVMFSMIRENPQRGTPFPMERAREMYFPYAVAYALLIIAQIAHNVFAFEGRGFNFLLIAPVRFREVLLAKNIVFGGVVLAETLVTLTLVSIFVSPPAPLLVAVTFAAAAFGALVHVTLGNVLSIHYPRRFDFGQFKQRQSGLSVLFGLLTQIVLFGVVAIVFAAARWLGQLWLAVIALLLMVAAGWQVYMVVLEHAGRVAERRREELAAELCKE